MNDPAVDLDVAVNIGVLGNVKKGSVRRGTRVEDAVAQFGWTKLQSYTIRAWTRTGNSAFHVDKDDTIDEDMTILLLQPIVGEAPKIAEQTVGATLADSGVTTGLSEPAGDWEGRSALRVTIVLEPGAAERISGLSSLDMIVQLQNELRNTGDERFPIVEYATKEEIEESGNSRSGAPV